MHAHAKFTHFLVKPSHELQAFCQWTGSLTLVFSIKLGLIGPLGTRS